MEESMQYESAKNWDYLGLNLYKFNDVLKSYGEFFFTYSFKGHQDIKFEKFKADLSCFYLMNKVAFEKYLEEELENTKILYKKSDYENIIGEKDRDKIIKMFFLLTDWSQADGVFKLIILKSNPKEWFKGGTSNR